jgi:predicted RNA binding protein YcfA (HicA-like mRNA interferase family)
MLTGTPRLAGRDDTRSHCGRDTELSVIEQPTARADRWRLHELMRLYRVGPAGIVLEFDYRLLHASGAGDFSSNAIDEFLQAASIHVTSQELARLLKNLGCVLLRQKGSHQVWRCGTCQTVIPVHKRDIPNGTLRAIQRQLELCLGEEWWKNG